MTLAMAKQAVPRMVASRKPAGTESLGGWEDGRLRRAVRRESVGSQSCAEATIYQDKTDCKCACPQDKWLCQMLGF